MNIPRNRIHQPLDEISNSMDNLMVNQHNDNLDRRMLMYFKSRVPLEPYTRQLVSVPAIDDETLIFSAQLASLQPNLQQLMIQINNSNLINFEEIPVNGSICLGQLKDGLCYRSTMMGVKGMNLLKLYTVDYGTTEMVPFSKIFQIEPEFVSDKVYAYRFTLQGLLLDSTYLKEIHYQFQNIVKEQLIDLEVLPSEGSMIVQRCNLFLDGKNIADIINRNVSTACNFELPTIYPTFGQLKVYKGSKHNVLISYIETVSHFYIHLYENKVQLDDVMEKLNVYCASAPVLTEENLQLNMPCAALFPEDNIWYRASVIALNENEIKVQYVDYGNCETVDINSIKLLCPELIECLEAQALLCSLCGLEGINQNESTTAQLEMLCLEKILNMTVVTLDVNEGYLIIDLEDSNLNPPLNISNRIVELSTPRQNRTNNNNAGVINAMAHNEVRQIEDVSQVQNGRNIYMNISSNNPIINKSPPVNNLRLPNQKRIPSTSSANTLNQYGTGTFKDNYVSGMQKVTVSWFINPHNFYCQIKQHETRLLQMMKKIQERYCNNMKNNQFSANVNDAVIVKYKQDNIIYRGQVLSIKKQGYVIYFVDYGFKNLINFSDAYPIYEEFLIEPKFAIKCRINNIISVMVNKTNLSIVYSFFQKNIYECIFAEVDKNGFVSVELSHEGKNVGVDLIENGYAIKAKENIVDDINFDLLPNQAIRGRVLGIKNFQRFFIMFNGTNSQLECALYNFFCEESNSEYNKLMKYFCEITENNTYIFYINEVIQTKLFVTLYDAMGMKVSPFGSDNSLSSLLPLNPKPIYNGHMKARVSHRSGNKAYIQDVSDWTAISDLLDGLFEFYSNNGVMLPLKSNKGTICAAQSLLDENWYRALILECNEDILVRYLDYGNEELLPLCNVKELHSNYFELHALCLEVTIDNDFEYNDSEEAIDVVLIHEDHNWKLRIQNQSCNDQSNTSPRNACIESQEKNLTSKTLCHGAVLPDYDNLPEANLVETTQETSEIVQVTHTDSPNQFWVQKINKLNELNEIHASLQTIAEKLPSLTTLHIGKICVAKYSIDEQWYRSIIIDADNELTTVRFIDYGNTETYFNEHNLIKDLDGDLKTMEAFATKCSLMAVPAKGDEWSDNVCKVFEEFIETSDTFRMENIIKTETCSYVRLLCGETDIAEHLIANGHALVMSNVVLENPTILCSDSDVMFQKKTGYISHFITLNEFYVQLECDRVGLEFLEDALANAETFPVYKNPVKNAVCVAQFADDMLWYRASILQVFDDHYEVFFVDFGNTSITTEIREMPEAIDNIGQLAKQCYISIPNNVSNLSSQIGEKLQEISADGLTVFEIDFMTLNSPYETQLNLNGENILSKILSEI